MQLHGEEWKPAAYAARATSDTKTRYAQTEKELLSIVFARDRFLQFVHGTCEEAEIKCYLIRTIVNFDLAPTALCLPFLSMIFSVSSSL